MRSLRVETDCDDVQIRRAIIEGIVECLSAAVTQSIASIYTRTKSIIRSAIQSSPEYDSILNGDLWHELGIVNPGGALEAVISKIEESIEVTPLLFTHNGRDITSGGVRLQAVQADFSDILNLREASFQSISKKRGTVYDIDWLQWLLTSEGSSNVPYPNSDFHFVGQSVGSRTRYGVMKQGGSWETEFAGTRQDNWLTRAIGPTEPVLMAMIFDEIERHV